MSEVKLTDIEIDVLRYAERNNGRDFVTALEGEAYNVTIHQMTEAGLFVDGGPSTFGRWRVLTPAGRSLLQTTSTAQDAPNSSSKRTGS